MHVSHVSGAWAAAQSRTGADIQAVIRGTIGQGGNAVRCAAGVLSLDAILQVLPSSAARSVWGLRERIES